ncbi:uncharacterized protein LOC134711920 [Mytilus trossulus]|uniref:uncharacterized protein LOC134711920 n=1 Tax=Mytilus trossulus TaxID=6551 RepID=UPI003003AECD
MAFSSSIRKGQTAMVCSSCKIDQKLKWKCSECGLLCSRCKETVHPILKSTYGHLIIDIKDVGKINEVQAEEINFSNLICQEHVGLNCSIFCTLCGVPICNDCRAKSHETHNLVKVSEGYEMVLKDLQDVKNTIVQESNRLGVIEATLHESRFIEKATYTRMKKEIESQEISIINAAKKQKQKLLIELDDNWDKVSRSLDNGNAHVQENLKTLLQQKGHVNHLLQSKNTTEVFAASKHILKPKSTLQIESFTYKHVPNFSRGEIENTKALFGSLEKVNERPGLFLPVLKQFQTDHEIKRIIVSSDNAIWTSNLQTIFKTKISHGSLKTLSKLHVKNTSIALTGSEDLLFDGKYNLRRVSNGTEEIKETLLNVHPHTVTAFHVSHANDILIAASGNTEAYSNDGKRLLISMDQNGNQKKVYQCDRNFRPLFTCIISISTNRENNIGIVDNTSEDNRGRVMVIQENGELRNVYTGHKNDTPFKPYTIEVTFSGNFVVLDLVNQNLHILNQEGRFITFCDMEDLNVGFIGAFCIRDSLLYIGCKARKKDIIHTVDISGW